MVASAIRTIDRAAEIVAAGQADLVAMMRAHIADPDIVAKAREGRRKEIRRCVGANQGCLRRLFAQEGITCTVNPVAGRERTLGGEAGPAQPPREVLVVGGGPAGMMLAETAALRGHRVTLLERAHQLGGQLLLAGRLPGRATWLELADDLAGSLDRIGVDVRLGTEADADDVATAGAEAVYLATGSRFDTSGYSISTPQRETIPGLADAHVLDPAAAITEPEHCGDRVVIVDDIGDYLPLGLALLLAETGRSVAVVTRHLHAGSRLTATGDLPFVMPRLEAAGVRVHAQSVVARIEPQSVVVTGSWGGAEDSVAADTVVLAMMRRPETSLHAALTARGVAATQLGDCLAPREVDDAMYEGMKLGVAT